MDINITNPVTTSKIGEVVNGASAATPNDTDLVPIVESSVTKKITLTNLKAFLKTYFDTLYSALTASSFGTFVNGLTNKTTPVDADELVISDSAESNVAKKVTGTNFKVYLKTYFDTIYTTTSAVATQITTALSGYLTSATAASTYAPIASPTFTGTATTPAIIVSSETASRVAIIDASKNVKSADTATYPSLTELAYVKGVTSAIQTQLDKKGYSITIGTSTGQNPAANTTYNWGLNGATITGGTTAVRSIPITQAGVITNVSILAYVGTTIGSSENNTLSILIFTPASAAAASTNQLTTTFKFDNANRINEYIGSGLNISVSAGDILQIQLVTNATLATPPTGCIFSGSIFVKTT
jgi:hypothetical protein